MFSYADRFNTMNICKTLNWKTSSSNKISLLVHLPTTFFSKLAGGPIRNVSFNRSSKNLFEIIPCDSGYKPYKKLLKNIVAQKVRSSRNRFFLKHKGGSCKTCRNGSVFSPLFSNIFLWNLRTCFWIWFGQTSWLEDHSWTLRKVN